ncbi:hypothetical protein G9A89_007497 [Geosiphon pyriformis]|nr:hypothetical protein G9A89_007497 [Geosiphon pyriformis]
MATTSISSPRTNRLANEKSPYLLQHADNPVDWYPWSEEAFQKARRENKPIFLSVGYSTCHWCHVMAHESFENKEIAKLMNENFVNVKVDREVQPDVDRMYMTFVQLTSGGGGWPMSVFLTPDLYPIFGGTYFPPKDQFGRIGFPSLLKRVAKMWKEDPEGLKKSGESLIQQLRLYSNADAQGVSKDVLNINVAHKCYQHFFSTFDEKEGGFGGEPKFPTPVQFHFLLRYYFYINSDLGNMDGDTFGNMSVAEIRVRGDRLGIDFKGCLEKVDFVNKIRKVVGNRRQAAQKTIEMVKFTLTKIAKGGIHDHIGNGFHRYSTDRYWHVPHFEKMLYDQAQLLSTYIEMYLISKEDYFAEVARDIVKYVERDLRDPVGGGFYSAEDADSYPHIDAEHKLEGAFAVWEKSEIYNILGQEDSEIFCWHFGVEEKGNVPSEKDIQGELVNKNVLIERHTIEETANQFKISLENLNQILTRSKEKLAKHRFEKRPKPHRDEKILTAWNGLMISALVRAYEALGEKKYLALAINSAKFLKEKMYDPDRKVLRRSFLGEPSKVDGFSDDYSFLIQGLLDLYEATLNEEHLAWAIDLQNTQNELFYDREGGGFFNAPAGNKNILLRMKDEHDGAEPSSNSVSVSNLVRLYTYIQNPDYNSKAEATLLSNVKTLQQHPYAMPALVASMILYLKGIKQIVIIGSPDHPTVGKYLEIIRQRFLPNRALILTPTSSDIGSSILAKRNDVVKSILQIDGGISSGQNEASPAIHICENFTCGLPIQEPAVFKDQLEKSL